MKPAITFRRDTKNVKTHTVHLKNGVFLVLLLENLKFLRSSLKDTTQKLRLFYQKVMMDTLLQNLKQMKLRQLALIHNEFGYEF